MLLANQTRIYPLQPDFRNRLNTMFMTFVFLGGAVGSLCGAVAAPSMAGSGQAGSPPCFRKWKLVLTEFETITALTAGAQLLDFTTLPLDDSAPVASMERFLRTSRLLKLRDSLPETSITLLEVLEKIQGGRVCHPR